MKVEIHSIPMSEEERKTWADENDTCPICNEPFGTKKQVKTTPERTIIHKRCSTLTSDGERPFYIANPNWEADAEAHHQWWLSWFGPEAKRS